ncbi:MAG: oxidoreductase [Rhodobacteraceae bacterium PARR1]|nr:MAG: oxidoreductase [Rhodobacteraceae bacterium PARR1]
MAVIATVTFGSLSASQAEVPPAPSGQTILFVDGAIANTNVGSEAQFDLESLMTQPSITFTTSTTWTEGTPTFTGVPLKALLEALGATGTTVTATALNNYAIDIPVDSLNDDAPIVAYHIDGKSFSRRDKGPLWIVYPYDSSADYRNDLVYGRSIWQLERLTVK